MQPYEVVPDSFPKWLHRFLFPKKCMRVPISPYLQLYVFYYNHPSRWKVVSHCILICTSLIFSWFIGHLYIFLEKYLLRLIAHLKKSGCLFITELSEFLTYFSYNLFTMFTICNLFLHSAGCLSFS